MTITFEQLAKANQTIQTTQLTRYNKKTGKTVTKDYAEVPQRVKAFRICYPMGSIQTEMVEDTGKRCVFRAKVFDGNGKLLGTGTAFEDREGLVNSTSYIENCETSAVGRALGFAGFGVDYGISSYEEVFGALEKQDAIERAEAKAEEAKGKEAKADKAKKKSPPPPSDGKPTEYVRKADREEKKEDQPAQAVPETGKADDGKQMTDVQAKAIAALQTTEERIAFMKKCLDSWNVSDVEKLSFTQAKTLIKRLRELPGDVKEVKE